MNNITGCGAPIYYDHNNAIQSGYYPSIYHGNCGLSGYFAKYLIQRAMSVFKWDGIPDNWSKEYFLYCLYCWGYVAVINTDKFGIIPQGCSLSGYNVFYEPTKAVIANPLFKGLKTARIGVQTEIIKLQPNYSGIMDIVSFFADLMALTAEGIATNITNSKLSYVFAVSDKAAAESMKKMYDKIASGEPCVVYDKTLQNEDKDPWTTFSQNLKQNYLATDMLADLRTIQQMFDTEIGIPNANMEKKERMIVDEVNANNFETASKCNLWLENLQKCCKKVNNMFGLSLSVDWQDALKTAVEMPKMGDMGGVSNDKE